MNPKTLKKLARPEIRNLAPCIHGGDVWDVSKQYNVRDKDILEFSANVNPLGPSQKISAAIQESYWQIPFYPDLSSKELREAIARYYGDIEPSNIIVGNGSMELIYLFCEAFLERQDRVLIPAPTFGEYESAVKRVGGRSIYLPLDKNMQLNATKFVTELEHRYKILYLCNPNNPTSILASRETMLEILEAAKKKNVLVFLDEDFIEFVDTKKRYFLVNEIQEYPNLFVLRSFTKVFGMAGLRIGYGIGCTELIGLLYKLKVPWSINCLAQAAAIATLQDTEYLKRSQELIQKERQFLVRELEQIREFQIIPPDANFILINIRECGLTAAQLKKKLIQHHILIRDCTSFEGLDKYYIRVAVRTHEENITLIQSLKKVMAG